MSTETISGWDLTSIERIYTITWGKWKGIITRSITTCEDIRWRVKGPWSDHTIVHQIKCHGTEKTMPMAKREAERCIAKLRQYNGKIFASSK